MARSESAQPHFALDDYRIRMNIPIWAFNGVDNGDEVLLGCDKIWAQWERDHVADAIAAAEEMLAGQLCYTLGLEFHVDNYIPWTSPMLLEWGYVIGGGVQGLAEVTPSASDFTTDPATITVPQSGFPGGTSEIAVEEDATGLRIVPDDIATSGTDYIISISQAKLIEWDNLENQVNSIDYDAAFPAATWLKLADLTIYREYLDTSEQATIEFGPRCNCMCNSDNACAGTQYDACIYVTNGTIGEVKAQISDYDADDDAWTCSNPALCGCYEGDQVSISYRAGTTSASGYKRAVMRLAHTYMDFKPCGCGNVDFALARDRNVPTVLTAERINNPFGLMDGSWFAWQWSETHKHGRAFML